MNPQDPVGLALHPGSRAADLVVLVSSPRDATNTQVEVYALKTIPMAAWMWTSYFGAPCLRSILCAYGCCSHVPCFLFAWDRLFEKILSKAAPSPRHVKWTFQWGAMTIPSTSWFLGGPINWVHQRSKNDPCVPKNSFSSWKVQETSVHRLRTNQIIKHH